MEQRTGCCSSRSSGAWGAPAKRTLQQLSYSYDRVGNIVAVQNLLGPATDAHSGTVSYQHTYDSLYRLKHSSASALARPGVTDRFEASFAYSDIHNMSRNTQVRELVNARNPAEGGGVQRPAGSNHDWSYSYKGNGPHQVSQIGPEVFRHDANGNTVLECRAGQGLCPQAAAGGEVPPSLDQTDGLPDYRTFQWTEENWLRSVVDAQGQHATRFFYDASGQRVAKLGEGGVELSIGQFYSVVHGQFASKHVFAGPARVATKVVPVGGNQGIGQTGGALPDGGTSLPPGCEESGFVPNKCQPLMALGNTAYLGTGGVKPATYYYHPDHLGSTEWMTDQTGRVHEHVEYFPYGDVWRDAKGDADPQNPAARTPNYLFTGTEVRGVCSGRRNLAGGLPVVTAGQPPW